METSIPGWVSGENVAFAYRITGGQMARICDAAKDYVGLDVDVICTWSAPAAKATAASTRTIPIAAQDLTTAPVTAGYAERYARPGGNVTGEFIVNLKTFNALGIAVPDSVLLRADQVIG